MRDPSAVLLREVGARIAELRRLRGLTQDALSQRLKVTAKYLQRVEQGSENLTLRTLASVANELGVIPLHLLLPPLSDRPKRAGRPSLNAEQPPVKRVAPRPGVRSVIPLYTLVASAGQEGRADLAEVAEWVEVPGVSLLRGSFVLRVRGDSMEPGIPDGSLVVFRGPAQEPEGKVVLVEISEDGAVPYYLVKKLESERTGRGAARLVSFNERYAPRRVVLEPGGGVRVVAELVQVLPATTPR